MRVFIRHTDIRASKRECVQLCFRQWSSLDERKEREEKKWDGKEVEVTASGSRISDRRSNLLSSLFAGKAKAFRRNTLRRRVMQVPER